MAAVIPSWLCSNGAKSKFVRIVHPSGHIELHDGPVRAAEIILRNPEFCLTHSQSQSTHPPWAIVSPDTTLMLGRKYYLFPENTVGNLPSPSTTKKNGDLESDCFSGGSCMMCLFVSKEKEIGVSCRGRSECGEDLEGNMVNNNRRGVFLQNGNIRGSPQLSFGSSDNWQPSLNSISEEI